MPTRILIALGLLLVSLVVAGLLGKARAFGPLTSAGFVLGGVATGSVFVLFGL